MENVDQAANGDHDVILRQKVDRPAPEDRGPKTTMMLVGRSPEEAQKLEQVQVGEHHQV